jgi:hypothetical protein
MALALVDKLKTSTGESYDGLSPATDGTARPIMAPEESADCVTFKLAWVNAAYQPGDKPAGFWVGNFAENPSATLIHDAQWEMTLTPKRFLLWSPLTANLFNKMKAKPGSASGGQILYKWIDEIERTSSLGLSFLFDAKDKSVAARRIVSLEFASPQDATTILASLADRLIAFWLSEGIDAPTLQEELKRLRDIDWENWNDAEFSLLKAGAKPIYVG